MELHGSHDKLRNIILDNIRKCLFAKQKLCHLNNTVNFHSHYLLIVIKFTLEKLQSSEG